MIHTVIIGSGDIARKRHIPGILQSENGDLYGFYNRSWERTEAAVKEWGGHGYATYEAVLKDPCVDAVLIATPTPTHHDLVVQALRAGKHVLCEKPLALNTAQCRNMVAEAKQNSRKLMVCHVQRLYGPCQKARELIAQGKLGKILSFRTFLGVKGGVAKQNEHTPPWKNAVAELGSHRIDLMRYLLQDEAKRLFCVLTQLDPNKPDAAVVAGDDNAMAIVEYESGVYGMMAFSRTSYGGNDRTTTIFGTEGVLTIYGEEVPLRLVKRNGEVTVYPFACQEQSKLEITKIHSLFFDCIERDTKPFISGEDGLAAVETVDAMIKSNNEGRWVPVHTDGER